MAKKLQKNSRNCFFCQTTCGANLSIWTYPIGSVARQSAGQAKCRHVPDLLEAIMRPPGPVKEELRQKLSQIDQFGSKIKKIRVCTFQMSRKIPDSANVAFEAVIPNNSHTLFAIFGPARGQIYGKIGEKMRVIAL